MNEWVTLIPFLQINFTFEMQRDFSKGRLQKPQSRNPFRQCPEENKYFLVMSSLPSPIPLRKIPLNLSQKQLDEELNFPLSFQLRVLCLTGTIQDNT